MSELCFTINTQKLLLKYNWAISRNTSAFKINAIICLSDGLIQGYGEAAPNIRYGETPELLLEQFELFNSKFIYSNFNVKDADTGIEAFEEYLSDFEICQALRFGINAAFAHYISKKYQKPLSYLLGIRPADLPLPSSYSIPIMDPSLLQNFCETFHLKRFKRIKIKVKTEEATEIIHELRKYLDAELLVDGNECWTDVEALIRFSEGLPKLRVGLLEQPMPAHMTEEYQWLKKHSPIPLIADESCLAAPDMDALQSQFHGINMKLMKAGSYRNGIKILQEAQKRQMIRMIGCMVETSIGIASAMQVSHGVQYADLDGFLIIKDEPFGLVEEKNGSLYFNDKNF